jgi:hypothetical protein
MRSGGRLQVFAADDRTGDGVIPTLGILDEEHRHRDMRLKRTWRGKLAKRNGQLLGISTAGEPGTEFEDARARALGGATIITRDGFHVRAESPDSVIHDWSVPPEADVEDMAVVKQANPLSTITPESLLKKRRSPVMTETHWRRFVCNQAVRGEETAIQPSGVGGLGRRRHSGRFAGVAWRRFRLEARHDRDRAVVVRGSRASPLRCAERSWFRRATARFSSRR